MQQQADRYRPAWRRRDRQVRLHVNPRGSQRYPSNHISDPGVKSLNSTFLAAIPATFRTPISIGEMDVVLDLPYQIVVVPG